MGGACNSRGEYFQREWSESELSLEPHISLLEAREAVSQLSISRDLVRLHIDNYTALAYIRKQGGTRSYALNAEACLLWEEAISHNLTILTPQWIGSKENFMADFLSRNNLHHWEFFLDRDLFRFVVESFQVFPSLDCFASAATTQLPRYMSWFQDPYSAGRNALLCKWDPVSYLFPPVPLLPKVVLKVKEEQIRAILICPKWPSAMWWPLVMEMLVEPPIPLPHYRLALVKLSEHQSLPYLDPLVALHIKG